MIRSTHRITLRITTKLSLSLSLSAFVYRARYTVFLCVFGMCMRTRAWVWAKFHKNVEVVLARRPRVCMTEHITRVRCTYNRTSIILLNYILIA